MIRSKDIAILNRELSVLEIITRAFSEVASTHMKQTRNDVLANRDFVTEISLIFDEVRAAYADEVQRLSKKKAEKITFLSHNGKTVSVLLSAASGLYGSIVAETFELFKKEVEKNISEVTIAGRQGLALFTSHFPKRTYTYFDMSDKGGDQSEMSTLARHIVQYDEIHLFYGKFHTIVDQRPETLSIRSQIDIKPQEGRKTHYLFEPDLISILRFFESELFASVLTQTLQESTLSKYASRVLAMDAASNRITVERKKLLKAELSLKHRETNKKQLNSLSGILNMQ